jgi:hypothetical protein
VDTGGTPWRGRTLSGTGFDGDVGAADLHLLDALAARGGDHSAETDVLLLRRVASARWIVPIVAAPAQAQAQVGEGGGVVLETSTDMAVVTLTAPDGRRALPIFTSSAALAAWDAGARPVPVTAARAAQAAVAEGCEVVVVDVGSPVAAELRPSMVWALAQGREWTPAHRDPFVAESVARAVAGEAPVLEHRVVEGDPPGTGVLRVVLRLVPGLRQAEVDALLARVGERLATDAEFRARADQVTFALSTSVGS